MTVILWPLLIALLPQAVTLRITPQVLLPGGSIFLEARVTPNDANRLLRLDAEPEIGVSEFSLEGSKSPTVFRRRWLVSASGEYRITATVYDARHHILGYAHQRLVVADN